MRLTAKGRYAVTSLLDLAIHGDDKTPVSLSEISARQGISLSYLEQLFAKIRRYGLVTSIRGPGGGYCLKGKAEDISIADIVQSVNESMDYKVGAESASVNGKPCLNDLLWGELSKQIHAFLTEITLADMKQRADVLTVAARQDKEISASVNSVCL